MPRKFLLSLIAVLYVAAFCWFGQWRTTFLRSDSWGYYAHLPSLLLYHDVGEYSGTIAAWRVYCPNDPDPRADAYGLRSVPTTGRTAIKYTVGVALLESPFFLLAHGWCKATGQFPADGFSPPYLLLAGLSTLFYALLGLFFLEKTLRHFFPPPVVRTTLVTIALATNLFFFSTYTVGMAHPYLFFAWSWLIWASAKWYRDGQTPHSPRPLLIAASLGFALGLITLCRVPEVLTVLIPLLWALGGFSSLKPRWMFWREQWRAVLTAVLVFLLTLLPQLSYWRFVSGRWFFNSYQGEYFNWAHPQWLNGWFNYQNGWLIYTPVMALSLLGILWLRRSARAAFWPVVVLLPLHAYVAYAWWCWQYINGFGSRPMVETYSLLAFPLAALLTSAWQRGWSRWLIGCLLALSGVLNLFQTWQISASILWSERANAAYFKEVFGATHRTKAAYLAFESGEQQPDTTQISKFKTLFFHEIKDSTEEAHTKQQRHSEPLGFRCTGEFCMTGVVLTDTLGLRPGDWLRVSIHALMRPDERERRVDHLARLAVEVNGKNDQRYQYRSITVTSKIGNPEHILWHGGQVGQWGEAAFFVRLPADYTPGGNIKAYVWNGSGQKLYLDDLRLEWWKYTRI